MVIAWSVFQLQESKKEHCSWHLKIILACWFTHCVIRSVHFLCTSQQTRRTGAGIICNSSCIFGQFLFYTRSVLPDICFSLWSLHSSVKDGQDIHEQAGHVCDSYMQVSLCIHVRISQRWVVICICSRYDLKSMFICELFCDKQFSYIFGFTIWKCMWSLHTIHGC